MDETATIRIRTERLELRVLGEGDSEALFDYRSLPEVSRYQSWRPGAVEEVRAFARTNSLEQAEKGYGWVQLAVCLPDGRLIGDIGLHFVDEHQMEIGYTLAPAAWGKGYALEAVSAVIDYLFTVRGKHRITGSVDPDNERSIRLLKNLGFRQEAHFIKSFRQDGRWLDDCVYALLEDEWLKRTGKIRP